MRVIVNTLSCAALALIVCFACQSPSTRAAEPQEDQAAKAEFDFELLNVPDDKDVAFYRERLEDIQKALSERDKFDEETWNRIDAGLPDAYLVISGRLSEDPEASPDERAEHFEMHTSLLARKLGVETLSKMLDEEKAKSEPDEMRVDVLSIKLFATKIGDANDKKDAQALRALADELVERATTSRRFAMEASSFCELFLDRELGLETFDRIIEKASKSEDETIKRVGESMVGKKRFASLVGEEMVFEGLDLEGKEIDWNSYRGKVVLVDFFATWCGPYMGEVPNLLKNFEKYHEAGFDIVSYSVDRDLAALRNYETKSKHPWKTVSRQLSMEEKNDKGEPKYTNLSVYYGINAIPQMILVGKDGKVIETDVRGARLGELLKEQFPDVK